jgi:branched-chain amino acid transport system permease protein
MTFLRRHASFLVFGLLVMSIPFFTSDAYYLSVLAFTATRLMAMLGLNVLMGQAGQISLGHAAFIGLGAYGSAILTTRWELNPWLAMAVAAAVAGGVAGLIGVPTLKLKGHYLAMATLGFGEIVLILLIQVKWLTRGTDGIVGIPQLSLGPISFADPQNFHWLAWGVALVILRISLNLTDSRVGRALKGLHRAEIAASSLGVNTTYQKVQIFIVSAVFASLAGSFYAHYVNFISPDSFTLTFSVILVTGVVIGGLSSVWGAVWGTLFMMLLPEYIKGRFNEDYTFLVFGVLLIVIMIFMPGGLTSAGQSAGRAWRRLRGSGRPQPKEAAEEIAEGSARTGSLP